MDCDIHPKLHEKAWACYHHAAASIKGVVLQTQRYEYKIVRGNMIDNTISTVGASSVTDVEEKMESSIDDVEEDIGSDNVVVKKRRGQNRKKRIATKTAVVEVEIIEKKSKKEEAKK